MSIQLEQSTGFRAIAGYMQRPSDASTISLRDLMNRHRFRPQDPRTLGHISRRWSASHGSQVINVIQYNTYLMDVTINIFSVLDDILPGGNWFGSIVGSVLGLALELIYLNSTELCFYFQSSLLLFVKEVHYHEIHEASLD